MAFDGLFTRAMTKELADLLTDGRINRIHQPFQNELVIIVRAKGKNYKLLLSAHPSYARIQLTEETTNNPEEPPMFCMILRKHLERSIIQNIRQVGLDRIVIFDLKGRDELGDKTNKQLIVEIMGRHSNIILVDEENKKIIDSIKHIPVSVNRYRTILPGRPYVLPPPQDKQAPFDLTDKDLLKNIDFNSGKIDRQIVQQFAGISPLFAKEIIFRAGLVNRITLPPIFIQLMEKIKKHDYSYMITKSETKEAFYIVPLKHMNGKYKAFDTLSAMLDHFYFGKAERDRVRQQAHDLERLLKNEIKKNKEKIKKLQATLKKAKKADEYQLAGELLTAHMHLVKQGMEKVNVVNYYDPEGAECTIDLDPGKSPSENAQSYFNQYRKAKNAIDVVQKQMKQAEEEIDYFERLLQQISSASTDDIAEIREELMDEGYVKRKKGRSRKTKQTKPKIEKYVATDQTEILVGKNNRQNDYLTSKVARRDEIWLHTKNIPGSHVVIRSDDPSEKTIEEAAMIAAYFSQARDSSSVPVDFTKVRHVKKTKGAKPGFVIYTDEQTVYVTPKEEVVMKLRKNQ